MLKIKEARIGVEVFSLLIIAEDEYGKIVIMTEEPITEESTLFIEAKELKSQAHDLYSYLDGDVSMSSLIDENICFLEYQEGTLKNAFGHKTIIK